MRTLDLIANARVVASEALAELRTSTRGSFLPIVSAGLLGYLLLVLTSSRYLQQLGSTDIPRNSPHLIYLMTSVQGIWLVFAWAWVFASVVARDHDARLAELVYATATPLWAIHLGKFCGAFVVAAALGAVTPLGFLLVHPLAWMGAIPTSAVGLTPWFAIAQAWLVFAVPSALGLGSLYVVAALKTRDATGPMLVAGLLMAVWLLAMVVLMMTGVHPELGILMDPMAYSAVDIQSKAWTPVEKQSASLSFPAPLVWNRVLWTVVPVLALAWSLRRVTRESLLLGRVSRRAKREETRRRSVAPARKRARWVSALLELQPPWVSTAGLEWLWATRRTIGSWGFSVAWVLLLVFAVAGAFVHLVAHPEGPFVPAPATLIPVITDGTYLIVVFLIAGFVGSLVRRDEAARGKQLVDAAPVGTGALAVALALASVTVVASLSLAPLLASYFVTSLLAPESFSLSFPAMYFLVVLVPPLLEVGAVAFLLHSVFSSPRLAHALTMIAGFAFIVNYEVGLVPYPPTRIGLPPPLALSSLIGWSQLSQPVFAYAAQKIATCGVLFGLAWMTWRRGYAVTLPQRASFGLARLRTGSGLVLVLSLASAAAASALLHRQLVTRGDYRSPTDQAQDSAQAELATITSDSMRAEASRPLEETSVRLVSMKGGTLEVEVTPRARRVSSRWTLHEVRNTRLVAELPPDVHVRRILVFGEDKAFTVAGDRLVLQGMLCGTQAECQVQMDVEAVRSGWPVHGEVPWLSEDQAWLTASDVLPRLGIDTSHHLRGRQNRLAHGLPPEPRRVAAQDAVAAAGVAPAADWSVRVSLPPGWHVLATNPPNDALDFAIAWRRDALSRTDHHGRRAWHDKTRVSAAREIIDDVAAMEACLIELTGWEIQPVRSIVHSPRSDDEIVVGDALWLSEHPSWDVSSPGFGRTYRRWRIAKSIAARSVVHQSRLRREPGWAWLRHGVPGWLALECVRKLDSQESWLALMAYLSEQVTLELGSLAHPVLDVAQDGGQPWVNGYAPLATFSWAQLSERQSATAAVDQLLKLKRKGQPLNEAMTQLWGSKVAAALLGPPLAADVTLTRRDTDHVPIATADTWVWSEGQWVSRGHARALVALTTDTTQLMPAPVRLVERADWEPFTFFVAGPAFERSIADNRLSETP